MLNLTKVVLLTAEPVGRGGGLFSCPCCPLVPAKIHRVLFGVRQGHTYISNLSASVSDDL